VKRVYGKLSVEEEKILKAIDDDELVDYCKKLISVPSVFTQEQKISNVIEEDLKRFGLRAERIEVEGCGPDVVAYYPTSDGKDPSIVLHGHMDTVPVCEGWTMDPFKPTIVGNRLYGLGATDQKSGLAAAIIAAKALVESGAHIHRSFAVHAVTDEEGWSRGTSKLIEKGYYRGVKACIVTEPSNLNRLRNSRRGQALIDITIYGKAAHGAQPENGVNAIELATEIIRCITNLKERVHTQLVDYKLRKMSTSTCITKIVGGTDALSVPDHCVVRVSRHFLPGMTSRESLEELRSHISRMLPESFKGRFKVEFAPRPIGSPEYGSYETSGDSALVRTLRGVASLFGYSPPLVCGHSVADDCLIATAAKVPVVSYGPSSDIRSRASGTAHESDEYVYIDQLVDAAKIYAITLSRLSRL